jgi:hypothetical protein
MLRLVQKDRGPLGIIYRETKKIGIDRDYFERKIRCGVAFSFQPMR